MCILYKTDCDLYFIQNYMEWGLFQFTYGSKDSLVEFLHADNYVQAHIQAANALQQHDSPVVSLHSSQCYNNQH